MCPVLCWILSERHPDGAHNASVASVRIRPGGVHLKIQHVCSNPCAGPPGYLGAQVLLNPQILQSFEYSIFHKFFLIH